MARHARRGPSALRLEILEHRTLLSGDSPAATFTAAPDPATSLLVRFVPEASAVTIRADLAAAGAHVVESFSDGLTWAATDPGVDGDSALRQLGQDPDVVYAERDVTVQAAAITPDDPIVGLQWGLNSTGKSNVDINATRAWGRARGSASTIVAVLDTGIDLANPEFAGRIWTNPDTSGRDGYPDAEHGWNFVANTADVQDDAGHGTHVAGILAANGNNGIGGAGVDWNAQIMPLKVLDSQGNGSNAAIIRAIDFAVEHEARVINASWGSTIYSQAMADAIRAAGNRGVVFVTAAGNDGCNDDARPFYPASYRLSNQIVVTAVDESGRPASFSNFGARTVDLAAPGVNILSTVPGGFAYMSGTSMATPYVTGVVSLLAGLHPSFSATQLVRRILSTARPLPGLAGKTATGGIVDAARAVGLKPSGAIDASGVHPALRNSSPDLGPSPRAIGSFRANRPQKDLGRFLRNTPRRPDRAELLPIGRPARQPRHAALIAARSSAPAHAGLPNTWV